MQNVKSNVSSWKNGNFMFEAYNTEYVWNITSNLWESSILCWYARSGSFQGLLSILNSNYNNAFT